MQIHNAKLINRTNNNTHTHTERHTHAERERARSAREQQIRNDSDAASSWDANADATLTYIQPTRRCLLSFYFLADADVARERAREGMQIN